MITLKPSIRFHVPYRLLSRLLFILPVAVTLSAVAADPVRLTENGMPRAVVVVPAAPEQLESKAVEELVEHIKLISGAELPRTTETDGHGELLPIRIGSAADATLDEAVRAAGDNRSAFALSVNQAGIAIRGLSDEGTLFGVYELLEQLGVRWYIPGDLGRIVPEIATIELATQRTIQTPSIHWRRFQAVPASDWVLRARMGGDERSTGGHGLPGNPPRGTGGRQECLSGGHEPGALEAVIGAIRGGREPTEETFYIGMGPHDGHGFCQCDGCKALDRGVFDPLYGGESMTDRYIWFFNQVLDALEDDYPNLHIVWYVYSLHTMPPEIEPNPRIVGVFAPISLDRIRGMDNPMSPDRHILRWLVDEWAKFEPNEMYYRGYYNNLACPQFPKTQIDRVRTEIPELYAKGLRAMRVEVIHQSWANDPLTLYLASRLMWNVETDVDALLDEFYRNFYGPAETPMRAYHEGLESAFRDTPYITGSSYVYFPIFKNHPRTDTLRALLDEAAALLGDEASPYAERVAALRQAYRRMDYFLDMIKARNRHDYITAHDWMDAYDELTAELADYQLAPESQHRMVTHNEHPASGRFNYFNRFFRPTMVSGHHRTVEAGELVKGLADEWDFLIDPAAIGEIAGYYRPGKLGGNWQPMKTSSRSWSDQGLHYYKGLAWYRQIVTIPAEFEGRPIYLWFGGVDNAAKVWVNGELLGTNREPLHGLPGVAGTFRPFDFLATSAIRFGEENTVSVKVTNDRLAELGTGGLVAPVMFWSPIDPDWKP